MSADPHLIHDPDLEFDRLPVLSQIETDRFCEGCGYNLRMQGVRRDSRLEILLVRCPECNRYQPVAPAGTLRQIWWQRLAGLFLLCYALLMLGMVAGVGLSEFGITVATLEELGRHGYDYTAGRPHQTPLYQRPEHPDYILLVSMATIGSLMVGYVAVGLATILFHHWRPWAYVAYAAALPLIVGTIIWVMLGFAPNRMADYGYLFVVILAGLQIMGGLMAVPTGRPIARMLIRLFLPPSLRTYVAFLWSADGLQPPQKQSQPS